MNAPANPTISTSSAKPASPIPPWIFDCGVSYHIESDPASFHILLEYLVIVAKLFKANNVSIEFFPHYFLVN